MRRSLVLISFVALLLTACGGRFGASSAPNEPSVPSSVAPVGAIPAVPLCDEVEAVSAPAERYRDSPIYVANEMPVDQIQAWAMTQPGFEEIWIDRDHAGWVTVAFSSDAEARQADLEEQFPDAGAVAVAVDWRMSELEELQLRVGEELSPLFDLGSGILVSQGVVSIGVGVLKPERVAAIEERFAGERVCIEGTDPADAPDEGPQAPEGDGWRLLADELAGQPYRTGIATDEASYAQLWADIGLTGDRPSVDFETEVVIWFGAVYGSSCPNLRLDDVVVDIERAIVHAEIVLVDAPLACTEDARPRAYVVAVDRTALPRGPFAIQLDAQGPPAGAPEERTVVDVDLTQPGTVAAPGQAGPDPASPPPFELEYGSFFEPGFDYPYRLYAHCGTEWLGRFNDVSWRTDVPDGALDHTPAPWRTAMDEKETIELSIIMYTDPEPIIEATANGHTVVYRATAVEPPGCD